MTAGAGNIQIHRAEGHHGIFPDSLLADGNYGLSGDRSSWNPDRAPPTATATLGLGWLRKRASMWAPLWTAGGHMGRGCVCPPRVY